ncbi:peptidase S8 [Tenacibaculum sp. SZ-18]|uniref:S8 family serine peptidase n=1 Tax=Tenacibaculum sp. SZ-18 TaxID=754423 RepID=UPI000C2D0637|nr:S8 family serine peptidase [Tenacibaculum sp. SZ-18]AUC14693.1 peptidase S8 [Tenacibaculum sp. SZ-18]
MKKLLFFLPLLLSTNLFAQEHAWVYLKDKPSEATYIASPLTMLSQRALDRRTKQGISLDNKDVPIEASYYNQIKSATGITVLGKSKWLNAIHVIGQINDINNLNTSFTFIDRIDFANRSLNAKGTVNFKKQKQVLNNHKSKFQSGKPTYNYGDATNQIEMLGGDFLHENGYTGAGIHIAVIDAGFPNVNTLGAFSGLRKNNQILGGYDFVNRSTNFYTGNSHGTHVLSDIAAYKENDFIGTAPDASFYLFRTEDAASETPLEETLWVEAAERSDSLGVDIINTSLGYTTFDNSNYNYSYSDMNGETTFITRGAEIGSSRGMLLVTSAGNSGNSPWKYISAPADANSVFTVGAVNSVETIASFSSYGPTADGRVKPDVLGQGQNVYIVNYISGSNALSNGTSFSSPVMTGVIACFWQAFPNKTNMEIMDIVRKSADRYSNPTDQYGYGVPDFEAAFNVTLSADEFELDGFSIFPNPAGDNLTINIANSNIQDYRILIYNILGKEVLKFHNTQTNVINVSSLNGGIYLLSLSNGNSKKVIKLIKR